MSKYLDGFVKKCAEYNVDPNGLMKFAEDEAKDEKKDEGKEAPKAKAEPKAKAAPKAPAAPKAKAAPAAPAPAPMANPVQADAGRMAQIKEALKAIVHQGGQPQGV